MSGKAVVVDVVSDVICPWCFLGKRRLDRAIALVPEVDVAIRWRPYFLDPTIPAEGMDRRTYMVRKFGEERLKIQGLNGKHVKGPQSFSVRGGERTHASDRNEGDHRDAASMDHARPPNFHASRSRLRALHLGKKGWLCGAVRHKLDAPGALGG